MKDKNCYAKIVHLASSRFHRVSRFVLPAKVHGLVGAVDMELVTKETLGELLGREVEMEA